MAREMIRCESAIQTLPSGTLVTQRRHGPSSGSPHKSSPQKIQANNLHLSPCLPCLVPRLCRADFSLSFLGVSWSLQSPAFLLGVAREGNQTHLRFHTYNSHLPAFNLGHKVQSLSLTYYSAS